MKTTQPSHPSYIRTQTVIFIGMGLFVAGYIVGMAHTIYRSLPEGGNHPPASAQAAVQNDDKHAADMAKMEAALIAATQKDPQNLRAWAQLGNIYFDRDSYPEAISAYQKALTINPNNADLLTDLGVMYRRNKQPKKAVEAFDRAIAVNPRHEMARFNKGIVLMHDLHDSQGAIAAWKELQAINPDTKAPNGLPLGDMIKQLQGQASK